MTQRQMYGIVYDSAKAKMLEIKGVTEDKASRLANKYAVKNTWIEYQKQC